VDEWPFDPSTERYISLATFRRNGREVRTPVWVAAVDTNYYVFSAGGAGKVKRIRANGRASLAACDVQGKVFTGWLNARGRIVSDVDLIRRVHEALRCKYGWRMVAGDLFSKLTGRYEKRAFIELEIVGSE
jgi:PPOX class probable F420-dependent enzyme